ncbi:hypothetical protein NIES22_12470 [Calothrix brevissima NIES-22]|nr:hypothetical protein NIES22_12470 [Calothrix brevissima NIES-22]
MNDRFIQEIELCYFRIIEAKDTHTSRHSLVSGGILHTRFIGNLFTLLSAVDNVWESFKALNIVKRTRFIHISATELPQNTSKAYLKDTKPNQLSELKEVTLLTDNENTLLKGDEISYRYFYPEDVKAEKERRLKEKAASKKELDRESKEIEELEARELGRFGDYAGMVHRGELALDDPRYPF